MKTLFTLICLVLTYLGYGQPIVIDSNDDTKTIFDYEDPFSLVSILYNNQLVAIDMDAEGVDPETLNKIRKKGWDENLEYFVDLEPTFSPMVDDSGEYITQMLPDGIEEFVYYPADTFWYDMTNISRLLVHKGKCQNPTTGEYYEGIDRLDFKKQFKGKKYYTVFSCSFQKLANLNAFKVLLELPQREADRIVGSFEYYQSVRDTLMKLYGSEDNTDVATSSYEMGVQFLPSHYGMYMGLSLRLPERGDDDNEYNPIKSEMYNPFYSSRQSERSWLETFPFTFIDNDSLWNDQAFLSNNFDSAYVRYYHSDIPLTDEYGDPLVITKPDGTMQFSYPLPTADFFWIDFKVEKVYALMDFYTHDSQHLGKNMIKCEKLFFTKKVNGFEKHLLVTQFDMYDLFNGEFNIGSMDNLNDGILQDKWIEHFRDIPWMSTLRSLVEQQE